MAQLMRYSNCRAEDAVIVRGATCWTALQVLHTRATEVRQRYGLKGA
jgi:hypothetical protein